MAPHPPPGILYIPTWAISDSLIAPAISAEEDGTFVLDLEFHRQMLRQRGLDAGGGLGEANEGVGACTAEEERFLRLATVTHAGTQP